MRGASPVPDRITRTLVGGVIVIEPV